jgi:lipoprotein-anchoring transpeptidase ErfK/SrfK
MPAFFAEAKQEEKPEEPVTKTNDSRQTATGCFGFSKMMPRARLRAMRQANLLATATLIALGFFAARAQEPQTPATPQAASQAAPQPESAARSLSIDIDLAKQKAFLLLEGKVMYETPISSGRPGHLTPTGEFSVLEKDPDHKSTLYGIIVDANGRIVNSSADVFMPLEKGCKFVSATMKYFLRFDGATGMHAGFLPGYPASHGCVRLPAGKAHLFFDTAEVGTPVHVHGTPPEGPAQKTAQPSPSPPPDQKNKQSFLFPWLHR